MGRAGPNILSRKGREKFGSAGGGARGENLTSRDGGSGSGICAGRRGSPPRLRTALGIGASFAPQKWYGRCIFATPSAGSGGKRGVPRGRNFKPDSGFRGVAACVAQRRAWALLRRHPSPARSGRPPYLLSQCIRPAPAAARLLDCRASYRWNRVFAAGRGNAAVSRRAGCLRAHDRVRAFGPRETFRALGAHGGRLGAGGQLAREQRFAAAAASPRGRGRTGTGVAPGIGGMPARALSRKRRCR